MDTQNKCCGNCRFFGSEDLRGYGKCQLSSAIRYCGDSCISHRLLFDSWTEITPDNVDELYESKQRVCVAFVCNGEVSYMCGQFGITLSTMAKYGGYYYYVLPELKIE